jgi:hypothetical protein
MGLGVASDWIVEMLRGVWYWNWIESWVDEVCVYVHWWLLVGTYISQHVAQARWLGSFSLGAIGPFVFCLFFAEVQEHFVVWEEGGLGVFDLKLLGEMSIWKVTVILCFFDTGKFVRWLKVRLMTGQ